LLCPPQAVTARAPAVRIRIPKAVQVLRLGAIKISRHPSASPPSRSPKSSPSLVASAAEEPTVFSVRVVFTTEAPVIEAVAGTVHVGTAVEVNPPETAQVN
jgi:hypothetical protein